MGTYTEHFYCKVKVQAPAASQVVYNTYVGKYYSFLSYQPATHLSLLLYQILCNISNIM